jgi:serine/threonine-protein kinase
MRDSAGGEHPYLLLAMQGLAVEFWTTGDLEAAAVQFNEVLELQTSSLGRMHPVTLTTAANLGTVYRDAGRIDEAIALLEETSHAATNFPELATSRGELRTAYALARKTKKFREMLECDLATVRDNNDPESLQLAAELTAIGSDLMTIGDFGQAEPLLREGWQIRQKLIPDDWRTYNTQSLLGEAVLGQLKKGSDIVLETGTKDSDLVETSRLLEEAYQGLKSKADSIPAIARLDRQVESINRLIELTRHLEDQAACDRWSLEKKTLLER